MLFFLIAETKHLKINAVMKIVSTKLVRRL